MLHRTFLQCLLMHCLCSGRLSRMSVTPAVIIFCHSWWITKLIHLLFRSSPTRPHRGWLTDLPNTAITPFDPSSGATSYYTSGPLCFLEGESSDTSSMQFWFYLECLILFFFPLNTVGIGQEAVSLLTVSSLFPAGKQSEKPYVCSFSGSCCKCFSCFHLGFLASV